MDYEDMLSKAEEELPEDRFDEARFEIPDAETQKDGSKTVLRNFSELVDTFNREASHLSKYLLNELGTAGHVDGDELVLNGSFRRGTINAKIQSYADEYVICPECGKPDTRMVKEKGVELLKCEACGARHPIE